MADKRFPHMSWLLAQNRSNIQQLQKLSRCHQAAFAACCCERLLPVYAAHKYAESQGDSNQLRNLLDQVWAFAANKSTHDDLMLLPDEIERLTPDFTASRSPYAYMAAVVADAIRYAVKVCLSDSIDELSTVIELAFDVIDYYLNIANYPYEEHLHRKETESYQNWLDQSPLLHAELKHQSWTVQVLIDHEEVDEDLIRTLREHPSMTYLGIDPLYRGLLGNHPNHV